MHMMLVVVWLMEEKKVIAEDSEEVNMNEVVRQKSLYAIIKPRDGGDFQ